MDDESEYIPDALYEAIAKASRLLYERLNKIKSQYPQEDWRDTDYALSCEMHKLEEIDALVEQTGTKEANELLNEIFAKKY